MTDSSLSMKNPRSKTTIRNAAMMFRPIDFGGLRFGLNRPTDIDGLMLMPGRLVVLEFKCGNAPVKGKQEQALRFVTDSAALFGVRGGLFVARYYDRDPNNAVDAAQCMVTEFYDTYDHSWHDTRHHNMTLRRALEQFLE